MTHKELLELFITHGIEFIVLGGVALRLYNSPRLTHDIDLAVRTLDVDAVTELMYRNGYYLIMEVRDDSVPIAANHTDAQAWLTLQKAGSASLIQLAAASRSLEIPMQQIDLSFRGASRDDLITLKKLRSDKSSVDADDIRYLESLDGAADASFPAD
jgi:Uncharacterised nucleotidyltransferase